ncbi:MAG: Ig-like domain-containing protein, partial [Thermoanaerobaculia bacterium]|nr:Ig-like domain-containing protein [Thermoanaerobaculia bacterium]
MDLGVVVLDDRPPQVVAVEPADGAFDVAATATVAVRFSEPMDAVRSNDFGDLQLVRVGGASVALVSPHVWEEGNRVLRATPLAPLDNFTSFRVVVGTNRLQDLAGRRLAAPFQAVFSTADARPPAVVTTIPAAGALNVPVDQQVRVQFDEAVTAASLSGAAVELLDLDSGAQVTTTFTLLPGDREVLVTPAAALAEDHVHELRLSGVSDHAGNAMSLFVLRFETRDASPPAVTVTSPAAGTTVVSGATLALAATVVENQAMGSVRFHLLGLDVAGVPNANRTLWTASVVVPPVAESRAAEVEAVATDAAGLT